MIVVVYLLTLRHLEMPLDSPATATATLVQHNLGVGTEANSTNESVQQLSSSFIKLSLHPGRIICNGIPELASTQLHPLR